ncbi:uncharacterized protein LOC111450016 isoform X1 [Cucurbita moschata]|uniref:Uncharacterized protein LOC111450016 isoform X1 n=1 Tax=Cucurbita moschata TaxID=3662 RepID=A0A6J1G2C1_CUCMO|nr:uncharacterized protein LOC111450016 isoform X1 [Cucurbita moschata]XP_022945915.1 uncharacterized protein LOC111450016 isoform X1 [Cucurbita moschata]
MNFLLRSTPAVPAERPSVQETPPPVAPYPPKPAITLESLISEMPFPQYSVADDIDDEVDASAGENGSIAGNKENSDCASVGKHSDVSEEEGWITIPCKDLPSDWRNASDVHSLRSKDRSFVFPGEQICILACLSAYKQDTATITPFKVAAVLSKHGKGHSPKKQNGNMDDGTNSTNGERRPSPDQSTIQNGENLSNEKIDSSEDVSASESLLRMEDHRRQTETLLQRFKNSHFFVRIAESSDLLWSKKIFPDKHSDCEVVGESTVNSSLNADQGNFGSNVSGGVARGTFKCCSLSDGSIVVLLHVNVGVDILRDPVLEILQFEKYQERTMSFENQDGLGYSSLDPYGELMKWLLPLDNTIPSISRPLSPPRLIPNAGISGTSQKTNASASSGSQLFSLVHFRSYSMSSIPHNTAPPPAPIKSASSKPSFELESWDQFSPQKSSKRKRLGVRDLLSFRGISLEQERFSVCCGLKGIHIPGRRWRRKLEIIHPVEIQSFAADCNTDDLLCVQIKNVSPDHIPDIIIYIDAITIVFEEASKDGLPSSLPIACIEAGNEHSIPNLALRRNEEHSFIIKPATSMWRNIKACGERNSQSSQLQAGNPTSSLSLTSKSTDQYAIMVTCRCNYTESRLFFKQPTSWRPRISSDLMVSVALSGDPLKPNGIGSHLPVQVLTLQASNLTSEDLTMTVLAPSSSSYPSVISLNSSSSSPMSRYWVLNEVAGEKYSTSLERPRSIPVASENQRHNVDFGGRPIPFEELSSPMSDIIPSAGLGCSHLCLQSRIPLGCIPSQSTTTIKLELLPLTDGIITLETLQINIKEKGVTYIPEHPLKINATSSISTAII